MVCQFIGIIAAVFTIISFQQKTAKNILIFQFIGSALWFIHFYILDAFTGALINGIAAVRDIVFFKSCNSKNKNRQVLLFVVLAIIIYVIISVKNNYNILGSLVELLPIIGFAMATVALKMNKANKLRLFLLVSIPPWLLYNIINFSLGGIITKTFSVISIIIGILRLDKKDN